MRAAENLRSASSSVPPAAASPPAGGPGPAQASCPDPERSVDDHGLNWQVEAVVSDEWCSRWASAARRRQATPAAGHWRMRRYDVSPPSERIPRADNAGHTAAAIMVSPASRNGRASSSDTSSHGKLRLVSNAARTPGRPSSTAEERAGVLVDRLRAELTAADPANGIRTPAPVPGLRAAGTSRGHAHSRRGNHHRPHPDLAPPRHRRPHLHPRLRNRTRPPHRTRPVRPPPPPAPAPLPGQPPPGHPPPPTTSPPSCAASA